MFHGAEQFESEPTIVLIFYAFKELIRLNDVSLIEAILSDDLYLDTIGILECKIFGNNNL